MFHPREIFPETTPPPAPARKPLWARLQRLASWPLRVASARASMRQLAGMSDRELADIRLTRQDLRDASALSLSDDPTKVFAMRVKERACR